MIFTDSVRLATSLANQGNFQSAIELLGDRWRGVGLEPGRGSETDLEYAELLLLCGILTVELGRYNLVPSLAGAKDLLSQASSLFGDDSSRYEARFWLGVAYLRGGENHEALALADSILAEQSADSDVVFCAGRLKGLAHLNIGNYQQAERAFAAVEIFLETCPPLSCGKFYLNRGMLYRQTSRCAEAVADYEAASGAFLQCNSARFQAAAQNNMAGVYTEQGQFQLARESACRALSLFAQIGDRAHEAKAWDQVARVYEREGNFAEMLRCADQAVGILSAGDHDGWLAESLITRGTALARLGMWQAEEALKQALAICERQGDPRQAGIVTKAMWEVVRRGSETRAALREAVSPFERVVYERALEKVNGRITTAAHDLGLHHSVLQKRLRNHFPDLLSKRVPPIRRHKSVMKLRNN